ncbi:MAG: hypothetical protein FJW39_22000 [Acidobacteria bacterium]|nr:hypothetical protein [Acidobacteriota bacterium]
MNWRLLAALITAVGSGWACSCVSDETRCDQLRTAEVAFIGIVIEGSDGPGTSFGAHVARLRVDLVLRGIAPGTREVQVNPSIGTSCYIPLRSGERVMVLGRRSGRLIWTSGCDGTYVIRPDDHDTERLIKSFLTGPSLLFGRVLGSRDWTSSKPVADASVSVSGPASWSAKTDSDGRFSVGGLPPGRFVLSLSAPGWLPGRPERGWVPGRAFDLPGRGCVEARVVLWPDRGISGIVQREDGSPVTGVPVSAFAWWSGEETDVAAETAVTGQDGRFRITRLPDGVYSVKARTGLNTILFT